MDFSNTDPMFGSAVYQDVISPRQGTFQTSGGNRSMGVMDFDSYSRPTMMEPHDMEFDVDSPTTSESYCESDDATSIMGIQDSVTSPSQIQIDDDSKQNIVSVSVSDEYTDSKFLKDRTLILQRWGPHDVFPADKSWTLEQKAAKLIQLSPCKKFSLSDIVSLDQIEKPEIKVDILIDLVCKIQVSFRWNYVKPHELFKSYTVVTNCKKEKEKKDADGNTIPKRPMNAFMIWCQKCRTLMAHICPQLHNAIISKALGAKWKTFSAEERGVYEDEKIKLMAFHQFEFPDYKYRPKKKPKKSEEKPTPAPKSRSKKKQAEKPQPAPLRAINIADQARQNLDPHLKERLQVKMQVKIDPDLKRGIGKRATAIDLADLTGFQADFASMSPEGAHTSLQHSQHYQHHQQQQQLPNFLDTQTSSVFDTPENSPHEPRTPTDMEHSSIFPKDGVAFRFDEKISLNLDNNNTTTTINNNLNIDIKPNINDLNNIWPTLVKTEHMDFPIKSEPISPVANNNNITINNNNLSPSTNDNITQSLDYIKVEPCVLDYSSLWNNNNNSDIKTELETEIKKLETGPVNPCWLSVEEVDAYLRQNSLSHESGTPDSQPDMQDLMKFITTPDVPYPLPR